MGIGGALCSWLEFHDDLLYERLDVLVHARLIDLLNGIQNGAMISVVEALADLIQRQMRFLVCECHAELPREASWLSPTAS